MNIFKRFWLRCSKNNQVCNESVSISSDTSIASEQQPSFLYSKEAIEELNKIFPAIIWKPGVTIEAFAYNTGERNIIDFIERRLAKERFKVL